MNHPDNIFQLALSLEASFFSSPQHISQTQYCRGGCNLYCVHLAFQWKMTCINNNRGCRKKSTQTPCGATHTPKWPPLETERKDLLILLIVSKELSQDLLTWSLEWTESGVIFLRGVSHTHNGRVSFILRTWETKCSEETLQKIWSTYELVNLRIKKSRNQFFKKKLFYFKLFFSCLLHFISYKFLNLKLF